MVARILGMGGRGRPEELDKMVAVVNRSWQLGGGSGGMQLAAWWGGPTFQSQHNNTPRPPHPGHSHNKV